VSFRVIIACSGTEESADACAKEDCVDDGAEANDPEAGRTWAEQVELTEAET